MGLAGFGCQAQPDRVFFFLFPLHFCASSLSLAKGLHF